MGCSLPPRVLRLLLMLFYCSEAPACGCVALSGDCSPESFQGVSCVMPLCLLTALHLLKLAVHCFGCAMPAGLGSVQGRQVCPEVSGHGFQAGCAGSCLLQAQEVLHIHLQPFMISRQVRSTQSFRDQHRHTLKFCTGA